MSEKLNDDKKKNIEQILRNAKHLDASIGALHDKLSNLYPVTIMHKNADQALLTTIRQKEKKRSDSVAWKEGAETSVTWTARLVFQKDQ